MEGSFDAIEFYKHSTRPLQDLNYRNIFAALMDL